MLNEGGLDIIDEFIDMYKSCSNPDEKERIALVLGEVNSSEAVKKVLQFAISVSDFRKSNNMEKNNETFNLQFLISNKRMLSL